MEQLLKQSCSQLNIEISENQIEQFKIYSQLLIEWNQKINLTAITDKKDIIIKHFVDCISIASIYNMSELTNFIDIGTGAGFPGIPIKIMYPNINLTLVDSLNKRIKFLNELKMKLNLEDVECIHSRAEDLGKNKMYRERYNICASRAVANLAVLSEYCLPFVALNGVFIALKGEDIELELSMSEKAIEYLGGRVESIKKIYLPFSDIVHSAVIIKKFRHTPLQYPRKAGIASKQPII